MFYKINDYTVICVAPKVGSHSIREALNSVTHLEVSGENALEYNRRVAWFRDPIERVQSNFNHFFGIMATGGVVEFVPQGVIKCHSKRLNSDFLETRESRKYKKEWEALEDRDLNAYDLNTQDYMRFIDMILDSGVKDSHFGVQSEIYTINGSIVPNVYKLFETITEDWPKIVDGRNIEKYNSWKRIECDMGYRLEDLKEFYKEDIRIRISLQ